MAIWLNDKEDLPPPEAADHYGIVAFGGDFNKERLLNSYKNGIFPWPQSGIIVWFCPDPRFVLRPSALKISSSLKKAIVKNRLDIRCDTAFSETMRRCQKQKRKDQQGTWITDAMIEGYQALHDAGFAHSIEAYQDEKMVGGLYGVSIGGIFFGESMFSSVENASKICLVTLVAHLLDWNYALIDCQAHTEHLARLGAESIPRNQFLKILSEQIYKNAPGWKLVYTPKQALARLEK